MNHLDSFEHEVSAWPGGSVHSHRFGGREFRFSSAEIGHVHRDGTVDFLFRDRFGMRSWKRGLRKSIIGFRTLAGLLFTSAAKRTSRMHCG